MDAGIIVGIDVSKDRLDVAVLPEGRAFAVARDGRGLADCCGAAASRSRRMLVALEATGGFETRGRRRSGRRRAAGGGGQPGPGARLRQGARPARQDRPDRCRGDRPLRAATRPEPRPLPDEATRLLADLVARRRQIVEMIVAERQRREARHARRLRRASPGSLARPAEGADRARCRHRRCRARLAGLAREGGPARLRARRRSDHRAHPHRRAARARHARPQADRRARRPRALHAPIRPVERQELHRRRPHEPCAPPCSWPPWSPAGTTPSSRPSVDRLIAAGKPKMVALIAVARKLLTILNAILRDKDHGKPLDRQDSRSPVRPNDLWLLHRGSACGSNVPRSHKSWPHVLSPEGERSHYPTGVTSTATVMRSSRHRAVRR